MKPRSVESHRGAFSLVELLVAAGIGAAVITAAVLGFAAVSSASLRGGRVDVQLPSQAHSNLYGAAASYATVWPNPSYAEAAKARVLRDKLMEDASAATAVFVLGRNGIWTNSRIGSVTNFVAATDLRNFASPEGFRQFLVANNAPGASGFSTNQSGPLGTTNATVFVVGGLDSQNFAAGSTNRNTLNMVATYEIDFVPATAPVGTYVSVRRFNPDNGSVPTDYYHAFYPGEDNGAKGFRPLAAHFNRQAAGGVYSAAPNQPFTFLWWPDPLVSRLHGATVPSTGGVPWRSAYANMAGRTSLFTVVPTFPGQ